MPRDSDPMIGRVLDGRYEVLSRIDRGGMATVYEAHDLRLDHSVAVKVMHDDLGDDPVFAQRFVREARSAARISHPNVVAVTDQGDDDGHLFIVMEQVRGTTLRQAIRDESPMRPERALALLEQVLQALEAAHGQGIMHRDIKPENVLISASGQVKVADFGLARAFGADTQHTRTGGLVIGSVSYLAPEVIQQGPTDPRTDVYAAGVLLFELLTGRKPHEGDGAIQIAWKHVHEDIPRPSEHTAQHVPDFVDALVLAATARDRDRRPRDARVFLLEVRRARAALAAGVTDDPELAADFLPRPLGVDTASIDYVDDGHGGDTRENVTVDPHPTLLAEVPVVGADEDTTVIGRRSSDRLAAAGVVGAGVGAGAARTAPPPPGGPGAPGWGGPPPAQRAPAPNTQGGPPGVPADARGRRTSRRRRRGLLTLLVVVALVVGVAAGGWWLAVGRYTTTPGVINLSESAAAAKMEANGLELDVTAREFSETVTAGSVISTDPAAGSRIVEGGTVGAVVSKGPERYEVPKLHGRTVARAETLLGDANLELGAVTEVFHESVPEGRIVIATPSAGTEVPPGSAVAVNVSKGPKPIRIPDFTGRNAERAEAELTERGFEVSVTEENSDTVPKGRVISQDPDSGKGFKGDEISLVVSKGPVMVEVPRLQTQSVDEASAALRELGFQVEVVRTELYIGWDRVVRQSPGGGDSAPKGSTVTLYVV